MIQQEDHLYLFSGLGADERVFQYLDFGNRQVTHIKWVEPHHESLTEYAARLIPQIKDHNPILIGLSFGGMLAVELSKQIETKKVIVLASAKTRKELPLYLRLLKYFKIHQLLPGRVLLQPNFVANWFFGATSGQDKVLLKKILRDTDPNFFKWAINQVVCWKNLSYPDNIIHVHGTADRVLPIKDVRADVQIEGGGHFMTVNKSAEIGRVLAEILK